MNRKAAQAARETALDVPPALRSALRFATNEDLTKYGGYDLGAAARVVALLDEGVSPWRMLRAFTEHLAAHSEDVHDGPYKDGETCLQILGLVDAIVDGRLNRLNDLVYCTLSGLSAWERENDRAGHAGMLLDVAMEMRFAHLVEAEAENRACEVAAIARYGFARLTRELITYRAEYGRFEPEPTTSLFIVSLVRDRRAIARKAATELVEFIEADVRRSARARRPARREVSPHPFLEPLMRMQEAGKAKPRASSRKKAGARKAS